MRSRRKQRRPSARYPDLARRSTRYLKPLLLDLPPDKLIRGIWSSAGMRPGEEHREGSRGPARSALLTSSDGIPASKRWFRQLVSSVAVIVNERVFPPFLNAQRRVRGRALCNRITPIWISFQIILLTALCHRIGISRLWENGAKDLQASRRGWRTRNAPWENWKNKIKQEWFSRWAFQVSGTRLLKCLGISYLINNGI